MAKKGVPKNTNSLIVDAPDLVIAKSLFGDFGFFSIWVGRLSLFRFIMPNLLGSCTRYAKIVASQSLAAEQTNWFVKSCP